MKDYEDNFPTLEEYERLTDEERQEATRTAVLKECEWQRMSLGMY